MSAKINVLDIEIDNCTAKEAMKKAARDRGVSKRDIYNYLEQNKEK